ncbi:MAG TPA: tetratricopeptide repeat protein, partial [Polyangiaceae bacterium]|nr:tetratricopeptide repeat protein [Polyangiaceae bacterium]
QRPFAAENVAQTLHSITFSAPPDLEALRPDLPLALVELVYGTLAKDRNQRVPSLRQVSAVLDEVLRGGSDASPRDAAESAKRRAAAPLPLEELSERARAFPNNVPPLGSTLVGRKAELSELSLRLSEPGTRLLSITAPGGMGKTRLALEFAQELVIVGQRRGFDARNAWFEDGVFWVQLTALASSESIVPAIAEVLGVSSWPGQNLEEQLAAFLREKRLLLVLDNFEHLLDGASRVGELLAKAPGVTMLVTSRERLGLSVETVFPLAGLEFPLASERGQPDDFSAVRLFVQCARQQRPGFVLDPQSARDAARICRLVEGIPLGIVLSASWAGTLSPAEIAEELGNGLDFLATEWRDVPERQRSMRVVFEQSWSRLSEAERDVLSSLAVFRGGFTREAAVRVAGANLRLLSSLIDKCLLRRVPSNGRFETHELLRQYAREKLTEQPARHAECLDRHAEFFFRFVTSREAALKSPSPALASSELEAELDNVRAAWSYLVESCRLPELAEMAEPLHVFYARRAAFSEGEAAFAALSASLRKTTELPPESRRLLAYASSLRAMFLRAQGRYQQACELLSEALGLLDAEQQPRETAFALATHGSALAMIGQLELARDLAEKAAESYRTTSDAWGLANALESLGRLHANAGDLLRAASAYRESIEVQRRAGLLESGTMGLAIALVQQGNYVEGRASMLQALATFETAGDRWNAMRCRMHLANTQRNLGEYESAEALARQCLDFCVEVGNRDHEVWALFQLGNIMKEQARYAEAEAQFRLAHEKSARSGEVGKVALAQLEFGDLALIRGDFALAKESLAQSLAGFERAGQGWGKALALDVSALVAVNEGDLATAENLFSRALSLSLSLGLLPFACNVVAGIASLRSKQGSLVRAAELVGLARSHRAVERHTLTRRVNPLLAALALSLGAEEFEAALARGASASLERALES